MPGRCGPHTRIPPSWTDRVGGAVDSFHPSKSAIILVTRRLKMSPTVMPLTWPSSFRNAVGTSPLAKLDAKANNFAESRSVSRKGIKWSANGPAATPCLGDLRFRRNCSQSNENVWRSKCPQGRERGTGRRRFCPCCTTIHIVSPLSAPPSAYVC